MDSELITHFSKVSKSTPLKIKLVQEDVDNYIELLEKKLNKK